MTVTVSLGEICQFVGGGTPSRKIRQYWNGSIPWATVKDFGADRISQTAEFISQEGLNASASRIVPSGSVLLVTRVGLGKVAMATIELAINQDIKAVMPSDMVSPEYLFWSLKHLGPEIESKGAGATVKGVTLQDVKELKIPAPPLDEQRRIVGILNRAAKIERLRTRAQERLREFIPALFIRMFGDPIENQMGWKTASLGEVIEGFEGGRNVKEGNGSSRFRILKVSAVTGGEFDPSMSKPAPDGYVPLRHHCVCVGDLLVSRASGTSSLVGATVMVEREVSDVLLPDKIWRFMWRANSPIEPWFVYGLFQNPTLQFRMSEMATGTSGAKNISQAKLKTLPIVVPPLDRQRLYTKLVERARSTVAIAESGSRTASELSASLMSRLLREGA